MEFVDDLEPVADCRGSERGGAFVAICIGLKHSVDLAGPSSFRE